VRIRAVQKTLFSHTGPLAIGDSMERKPPSVKCKGVGEREGVREDRFWKAVNSGYAVI
jgi:hypothetical protein